MRLNLNATFDATFEECNKFVAMLQGVARGESRDLSTMCTEGESCMLHPLLGARIGEGWIRGVVSPLSERPLTCTQSR
jgi:hypothetical protein